MKLMQKGADLEHLPDKALGLVYEPAFNLLLLQPISSLRAAILVNLAASTSIGLFPME